MNELKQALQQAVDALIGVIAWDKSRNYIMPYRLRDPMHASIDAAAAALATQEPPQKERPDFLAGYDAGMADGKRCAEMDMVEAAAKEYLELPEPEPVARIRCWTKAGEGHAELEDWEFPGIEALPDGVHLLYASAPTQPAELAAVISERDQLRADLGELQAKYADACAELAAESVGAGKMVVTLDYLRGLKEHCESLESERDQLRAEVERLQSALDDDHAGESVAQLAAQRQPLTDAGHDGQDLGSSGGNDVWMNMAGKKAAGRLLDGMTHDGYPCHAGDTA